LYHISTLLVEGAMKWSKTAAVAILVLASACGPQNGGSSPPNSSAVTSNVPLGPLPRVAVPERYRLTLTIDPDRETFSGHAEIDIALKQPCRQFYLHGLDLRVHNAIVRLPTGRSMTAIYEQVDGSGVALLRFPESLPTGPATLVFDYDAPFGHSLFGLYKVTDGGLAYAFTQFEPIRARRVFPSFDEPGFKTPFDVTIIAPKGDQVVTNTPLASQEGAANGMTRRTFEPTLPLPTYLVAFAVGPLDIVDGGDIAPNAVRSVPVHLRGIATKGKGQRMLYTLALAHKIVAALEAYFGIAYPFQKLDLVAVPDFSSNAMENAGAITFRQQLLLLDASSPLDQRRLGLAVVAHEITHQWFGDLVTPKWWDDLWLNESFARWMQSKVAAEVMPDEDFGRATLGSNLHVMDLDELPSARRIRQPVQDSNDIENAFDRITYDKGAAVLAMFERYVGPDVFQRGIRAYLKKYAHGNATAHDFIREVADAAREPDLVPAFDSFLNQPGIPLIDLAVDCSGPATKLRVTPGMYAQIGRQQPGQSWRVPMCYAAGSETACSLVDKPVTLTVSTSVCPANIMPNAQGTGYYRFSLSSLEWDGLIRSAPRMSAADQLTLFHNLDADLHAGRASAAQLLLTIRTLAPVAQWDLLSDMKDALHALRAKILEPSDLADYRAFVAGQFGERLAAMGLSPKPSETPSEVLARIALLQLMIEEAGDKATTAALADSARRYLLTGDFARSGISPDLLQEAMRAGVLEDGTVFSDKLLQAFVASKDEYFRRSVIYAVAGSSDPAVLKQLLALALSPQMRTGELSYVYTGMQADPASRAVLWEWFTGNYDALLARLSPSGMLRTPGILGEACDGVTRAQGDYFFRPKIASLPGTPRTLALAEEQIDRCVAFRDTKGAEIRDALRQSARN
jgi:alanyl aminopeptidase